MASTHDLQIVPAVADAPLRPDQKRFNTLIRQIEKARRTLSAWHDNVPRYLQARTQVVEPLVKTLAEARRAWAFTLDGVRDQPGWTPAERATFAELIRDTAADLLDDADGEADPALKALAEKHAAVDAGRDRQDLRVMAHLAETMTGVDLGDLDGIASRDDLMQRLREGLAAQAAEADARAEADAARQPPPAPPGTRRGRKSTAQQRREAEAQQAAQSLREVFRKLASALHPDRESDADRRAAKTALMQKVNQAYAASDLLALLELQLQIEQVDAARLADAGTQRLKHYNQVLAEQLAELKAEIDRTGLRFNLDFGVDPELIVEPTRLLDLIDLQAADLRSAVALHQREMHAFADKAATRRWLKREKKRLRDETGGFGFF